MTSINIPKLRFPEFSGEWEKKKLGNLLEKLESGVSVNSLDEPIKNDGEFGVLKTSSVYLGNFISNENKKIVDAEIKRARVNPIKDSILISRMNTPQLVGNSGLVDKDYPNLFVPDRLWLAKTNKITSSKMLSIILSSEKVMSMISNIATGTSGSMKNISQPNFLNLDIFVPSLPEQQKIASFLTAVDDKLQALKKKKSLLEQYKKGVMQKIFSQELRFKDTSTSLSASDDGKEFPKWEVKKLREIASKRIIKNKDNTVNLVFTNSAVQGIVNQRDFFDKDIANQNNLMGYYIVENNDFVYNPRISSNAPVGPISRNKLETGVMSPLYSVFRFKEGDVNFMEHFFNCDLWHVHMNDISNQGARDDRMSFLSADFYEMPIPFPILNEQNKIANFLSVIDNKINLVNVQIEKMEMWKKGLLQKMFV